MTTKSITRIALAIVMFFIFSNIIPGIYVFSTVPFTFQTLIILLLPFLLTKKEIYFWFMTLLVMTLIGIPIMSNFSSGLSVLFGPTAGFIYGWFIMLVMIKNLCTHDSHLIRLFVVMTIATAIDLIIGALWIGMLNGGGYIGTLNTILITFMPFGIVKVILAMLIIKKIPKQYLSN